MLRSPLMTGGRQHVTFWVESDGAHDFLQMNTDDGMVRKPRHDRRARIESENTQRRGAALFEKCAAAAKAENRLRPLFPFHARLATAISGQVDHGFGGEKTRADRTEIGERKDPPRVYWPCARINRVVSGTTLTQRRERDAAGGFANRFDGATAGLRHENPLRHGA